MLCDAAGCFSPAKGHFRGATRCSEVRPAEPSPYAHGTRINPLGDVFDHLDELVDGVSLSAGELDQLPHLLHDGAALGCPGHRDSAPASKLEQALVLK